jgi:hypothetical protein
MVVGERSERGGARNREAQSGQRGESAHDTWPDGYGLARGRRRRYERHVAMPANSKVRLEGVITMGEVSGRSVEPVT